MSLFSDYLNSALKNKSPPPSFDNCTECLHVNSGIFIIEMGFFSQQYQIAFISTHIYEWTGARFTHKNMFAHCFFLYMNIKPNLLAEIQSLFHPANHHFTPFSFNYAHHFNHNNATCRAYRVAFLQRSGTRRNTVARTTKKPHALFFRSWTFLERKRKKYLFMLFSASTIFIRKNLCASHVPCVWAMPFCVI